MDGWRPTIAHREREENAKEHRIDKARGNNEMYSYGRVNPVQSFRDLGQAISCDDQHEDDVDRRDHIRRLTNQTMNFQSLYPD